MTYPQPQFCEICHKRTAFRTDSPDNCVVCGTAFKSHLDDVEKDYCKLCQNQNPVKYRFGMRKCAVCGQVFCQDKTRTLPGTNQMSTDKQGKGAKGFGEPVNPVREV